MTNTETSSSERLHQVEKSWSPYDRLGGASQLWLHRLWERIGFSRHSATTFRYEVDMLFLRLWCFFSPSYRSKVKSLRDRRELRLHIGCGTVLLPGWINLDCYPPEPDGESEILVLDMRQGLPMSDASVNAIYSEHFFEHLPFDVVRNVMVPECFRLLEPGGVFRIGMPDGEFIVRNYVATKDNLDVDPHYTENRGDRTPMQMLNDLTHAFTHLYLWDYETLELVFKEAGFTDVRHAKSQDTEIPHFDDLDRKDPWRMAFTVYIEGRRPL